MFSGFLCKKENDFLISLSPCGKNLSFYTKLFSYTHQHLVRMMDQPTSSVLISHAPPF